MSRLPAGWPGSPRDAYRGLPRRAVPVWTICVSSAGGPTAKGLADRTHGDTKESAVAKLIAIAANPLAESHGLGIQRLASGGA
jgi:hypothetical protein